MNSRVCIVLSVKDGAKFLREQLRSLAEQTHEDWVLLWRDDGSSDKSCEILASFENEMGSDKVRRLSYPKGNIGVSASFMHLLTAAGENAEFFAFCDQDDVWLPKKIHRAVTKLTSIKNEYASLYCSRQILVDENLRFLCLSQSLARKPCLGNALAQNIATGCTIVMNKKARKAIINATPPEGTLHDHWSYLIASASGGNIIFDTEPYILYRQHSANVIGAPMSTIHRAARALKRGPLPFLQNLMNNLFALSALDPHSFNIQSVRPLLESLKSKNPVERFFATRSCGVHRQRILEDLFMIFCIVSRSAPEPEKFVHRDVLSSPSPNDLEE